MKDKKTMRLKRALPTRSKIRELRTHRLCVHRTPRHIYAQIIAPEGHGVVTCASSLEKEVKQATKKAKGKIDTAVSVGSLVAKRAKEKGIVKVAFDRSGFKYHGRVKALADAARQGGLEF